MAALDAIRLGAVGFDAVKQLVIAKVERRPVNLDLGGYPYLPVAKVKTTSAFDYAVLVSGEDCMMASASAVSPAPPQVLLAHHLRQLGESIAASWQASS
jgi:hypothetical protein